MVTVQKCFSAVTKAVAMLNDRWLAVNLSAALLTEEINKKLFKTLSVSKPLFRKH